MGEWGQRKKNVEVQSISTRTRRVLPTLDGASAWAYIAGTPLGGVLADAEMGPPAAGPGGGEAVRGAGVSPEELANSLEAVRRGFA
jgi:hypothetical protein